MKAITAFVFLLALATAIVLVAPGYSYLPNYTASGSGPQMDRWDFAAFPVTWNLNPAIGSNITGSRSVADVMTAAFASWQNAPNATLQVSRGADVSVSS